MKNIIKSGLKKIYNSVMYIPREVYRKKKRKALKNTNFSIISSDCFGSFVYHTLGERFNTPTINLFFSQDDFLKFVLNLNGFLLSDLVEIKDSSVKYPVGQLEYNNSSIRIDFMHYSSFEEAKTKWDERKKRVDFSNIYIIQVIQSGLTQEYADLFSALPYKNKLLITHENDIVCDCMVTHKVFNKRNYHAGDILRYKSLLSCKRHMDDIDYVGFVSKSQ